MKHDELSHIYGLNLFLELNVLKKVLQVQIQNIIAILNYIKKLMCCVYKIIKYTYDGCFHIKKLFETKINKILFMIYHVKRNFK